MTLIGQLYFDTLLRYVLSVTFRGAVVMKVMDQKTLVKSRRSYKVRITVYILTPREFARHEVTNTIMLFVCHPEILHKHYLQFLLGVKMASRETENNA